MIHTQICARVCTYIHTYIHTYMFTVVALYTQPHGRIHMAESDACLQGLLTTTTATIPTLTITFKVRAYCA